MIGLSRGERPSVLTIAAAVFVLYGCPSAMLTGDEGDTSDTSDDVVIVDLRPAVDDVAEVETGAPDLPLETTFDVIEEEDDITCADDDLDGVCNVDDVCPEGDDTQDDDEDGNPDACDTCPDADDTIDTDEDGIPNACDCDELGEECHANAVCVSTDDRAICQCLEGFAGDGVEACTNIDECESSPGPCAANANCLDTNGGFTCQCVGGYDGDPYIAGCTDINECTGTAHDCDTEPEATCGNTDGSFDCTCPDGFAGTGYGIDGCTVASCSDPTNVALSAAATSSGGGTGAIRGPQIMNDGAGEASCEFHWIHAGTAPAGEWFQYTWDTERTLESISIDTIPGCSYPTSARVLAGTTIEWWNGSSWVADGSVSGKSDDWSYTFTAPVRTTQLRLYDVTSESTNNPIIYEWEVDGCE